MTTRVVRSIVQQHAADAAFLWLLRTGAIVAPHLTLSDLARLDNRLEAHLDGLRVAASAGWDASLRELAHEEPGEVFVAAVIAFESGTNDRIQAVLQVASKNNLLRPVVSALGWLPVERAESFARQLASAETATLRRIGVAAAAIHRIDLGEILDTIVANGDDPRLIARALRAAGELGLTRLMKFIRPRFEAELDEVRFAAAWSGALLGEMSAVPVLGAFAADGGDLAEQACMVGLRLLSGGSAYKAHQELTARPELSRLAVSAAGMIGDPALVDWILAQMDSPALARRAGEAFALITGVDLERDKCEGTPPEGRQTEPTEDPEDENVAADPDDNLPWPDRDKLQDWWHDYRSDFRAGTRYIVGNPMSEEWLWEVLRTGRQRQRVAAALELALLSSSPLFEVRAPGFRQQRWLRG